MNRFIITFFAILCFCFNAIADSGHSENVGAGNSDIDSCRIVYGDIVYGDVEILIRDANGEVNFLNGYSLTNRIYDKAYLSKERTTDVLSMLQKVFIDSDEPVMQKVINPDTTGLHVTSDLRRPFMDIEIYKDGNKVCDTSVNLTENIGEYIYVYKEEFRNLWTLLDLVLESYKNICSKYTFDYWRSDMMPKSMRDGSRIKRVSDAW